MEENTEIRLDDLLTTKNIVSMYQDGNFLVCQTDTGQTFRHAIPANKILNKKEGEWILETLNIRG